MRLEAAKRQVLANIANLALHPSTGEGEWTAAAIAFFRVLRAKGVTTQDLLDAGYERIVYRDRVVYAARPAPDTTYHKPRYTCFGFGKYKGVPFSQVPYGYLAWALKNLQYLSPAVRQQIRERLAEEEFHFT